MRDERRQGHRCLFLRPHPFLGGRPLRPLRPPGRSNPAGPTPWPRAEAVGRALSATIIPPAYREAHARGLARFLATGEGPLLNRVVEVPALHHDGREFPAEISIAPVRLGEQYLFAAFIRDVTERKRAEEEIGRLNQELRSRVDEMQA